MKTSREIKIMFTSTALLLTCTLHAPAASAAKLSCRDAFDVFDRADHVSEINEFPILTVAEVQTDLDLQRRILESFFVDTKVFLTGKMVGNPPVEFSAPTVEARLNQILLQSFRDLVAQPSIDPNTDPSKLKTALPGLVRDEKARIRFAVRNKMKIEVANKFLKTVASVNENVELATALLTPYLQATEGLDEAKAKTHRLHAEVLEEARQSVKTTRREGVLMRRLSNILVLPVSFGAVGFFTDASTPLLIDIGLPLALTTGYNLLSEARAQLPVVKAKVWYQQFLAARERGKVKKAVVADMPTSKVERAVRTDKAFELAWEAWRPYALQAEAALKKEDSTALGDRVKRLSLMMPSLRAIQLPDGEEFASVVMAPTALTPERITALESGYRRRLNQIALLTRNVEWIERDLASFQAQLNDPSARPSYADDTYLTLNRQVIESLSESIVNLKSSLRSAKVYFDFVKARSDAGEHAFKTFLEAAVKEKSAS